MAKGGRRMDLNPRLGGRRQRTPPLGAVPSGKIALAGIQSWNTPPRRGQRDEEMPGQPSETAPGGPGAAAAEPFCCPRAWASGRLGEGGMGQLPDIPSSFGVPLAFFKRAPVPLYRSHPGAQITAPSSSWHCLPAPPPNQNSQRAAFLRSCKALCVVQVIPTKVIHSFPNDP